LDLTKGCYQVLELKRNKQKLHPGQISVLEDVFGTSMAHGCDAIIIFSQSWEEHVDHPRDVFERLKAANLKAKVRKCQLAMEEGHYLRHQVGRGRIELEQAKVSRTV
jgi:hypothetical protein